MARFFYAFGADTVDAQPPDTTEHWSTTPDWLVRADAGATDGKRVELVSGVARQALAFDDAASPDVVQVLARVFVTSVGTSDRVLLVAMRGAGGNGTEVGYTAGLFTTSAGTPRLDLAKYNGGTFTSLGNYTGLAWTTGVYYWIRAEASGTTVRAKVWAGAAGDEPTTGGPSNDGWHIATTDSALSSGWAGVGSSDPISGQFVDLVGIGTAGDTAPTEEPATADAGPDQTVVEGQTVTMAATGTGTWSQTAGTAVTLSDTSDPAATFTAPRPPTGEGSEALTFTWGGSEVTITTTPSVFYRLVSGSLQPVLLRRGM